MLTLKEFRDKHIKNLIINYKKKINYCKICGNIATMGIKCPPCSGYKEPLK